MSDDFTPEDLSSRYLAKVVWHRSADEEFIDEKYSRAHEWIFDGGIRIAASASPHIVPTPYAVEANVDPEEAFVAALSSCHMLFFLGISAHKKWVVESYEDNAVGIMEKNDSGIMAVTRVFLKPTICFSGEKQPSEQQINKVHSLAHKNCFLANSVKTQIIIESQFA